MVFTTQFVCKVLTLGLSKSLCKSKYEVAEVECEVLQTVSSSV